MPPAWKVRRGHLVVGLSVRLSVCQSFRNSVPLSNKVQYICILSLGDDTVTKLGL